MGHMTSVAGVPLGLQRRRSHDRWRPPNARCWPRRGGGSRPQPDAAIGGGGQGLKARDAERRVEQGARGVGHGEDRVSAPATRTGSGAVGRTRASAAPGHDAEWDRRCLVGRCRDVCDEVASDSHNAERPTTNGSHRFGLAREPFTHCHPLVAPPKKEDRMTRTTPLASRTWVAAALWRKNIATTNEMYGSRTPTPSSTVPNLTQSGSFEEVYFCAFSGAKNKL